MTDELQDKTGDPAGKTGAGAAASAEATKIKTSPAMPTYSAHAVHMARTAQVNTLTLSQMADQKASILMGATFLVFSLSVSSALGNEMPYSLMILAFFSFLSSLCAVMAVLPSFRKPKKTTAAPNKLFFGHFAEMDEEEWVQSILADMRSDEGIFRTMMHDIYQNGQLLARRKYRFLGIAYRLFIIGLFLTIIAFLAEAFLG